MALSQRLDLRQAQGLVMTPQLQQAIKLLQLSQTELLTFVEDELERNPLLEREEEPGESAPADPAAEPVADDSGAAEAHEHWTESAGSEGEGNLDLAGDPAAWESLRTRPAGEDDLPGLDQTLTRQESLRDHLLDQIQLDFREPAERLIAAHLLDLVDEAGYLQGDLAEIAERLGAGREEV